MRMSEFEGRNTRFSANVIKLEKKRQNLKLLMCYITELNHKHLSNIKLFSVYDDNIFPFFHEFNVFSIENCRIISNL